MILCITIIAKNVITSIIIGVVLGFNVLGMVVSAIEAITFNSNLSSYMLVNTITIQKDFDDIGDIRHVVSVAIIFILLFSFISVRYKSKEDLK
ncbi:hypothetical protein [Bacillus sp. JCM 19034]|uniref:hypothetical protein n=1 Tax=Bacillus sp. JCM 19034 TaxID=1481928 RepID=UPI000784D7E8|nr:hypothetical protein [Bacillus sp. JCM 19034]